MNIFLHCINVTHKLLTNTGEDSEPLEISSPYLLNYLGFRKKNYPWITFIQSAIVCCKLGHEFFINFYYSQNIPTKHT